MTTAGARTATEPGLCARLRESVAVLRRAELEVAALAAELDASDVPTVSGYPAGRRFVQDLARVDAATAKRWIAHGRGLSGSVALSGERLEPAWPAAAEACAEGAVGSDHVRVLARVVDAVSRVPGLGPEVVAEAEQTLTAAARTLPPAGVERVGVRLLAHLDPDGAAPLDPPAVDDELHVSTSRRDGSLTLSGRIRGAADAELLREVFDALSAPCGPDDTRPIARRRAEALLELAEQATTDHGLAHRDPASEAHDEREHEQGEHEHGDARSAGGGGDGDGDGGGDGPTPPRGSGPARGRPLLMVTIDVERLRLGVGHGLLDSDRTVAATEARRLGCDAGIVPVVLGAASQPLDVGRLSYAVPDGMRRALHLRDRGCSFPGCPRRPRRCHAHHVHHWADGGATALENLALLCRFHHQLVHHGDWQILMRGGRPWFRPPVWIDPARALVPGGAHRPDAYAPGARPPGGHPTRGDPAPRAA